MRRAGRFAAFTPPFNMSGQPAISLPVHRNVEDLPIGIQLPAYGRDDISIRVASQLEPAHPWSPVHPVILTPLSAISNLSSATRPAGNPPVCSHAAATIRSPKSDHADASHMTGEIAQCDSRRTRTGITLMGQTNQCAAVPAAFTA